MTELYRLHQVGLPAEAGPLYAALAAAIPGLSRRKSRLAITAGLVRLGDRVEWDPQAPITAAVSATVDLRQGIPAAGAQRNPTRSEQGVAKRVAGQRPFTVLHRDEDVLVIDKAAGLIAAPSQKGERGHVLELVRQWARGTGAELPFLGQIHRIDAPTSGCLVIALTRHAQGILSTQFATHCAEREYRALVVGGPLRDDDRLDGRIGRGPDGRRAVVRDGRPGKEAVTRFTVLQRFAAYSDLRCRLETGRTHQIRVHLASIGCPILGDELYARRDRPPAKPLPRVPRLMLHAHYVRFDHPLSGERVEVEAPLPGVYRDLLA